MFSRLPKEFIASLGGIEGFDAQSFEQVHATGKQVVSIRLNPLKTDTAAGRTGGAETDPLHGSPPKKIPWSSFGYYLPERPSFTFDPLFHAGTYYVQEASGMFLEQALRQTTDLSGPLKVLDLCAAPGGKSTLIQSLISPDSLLVSNEVIRSRSAILQENLVKWGAPNCFITQNDPSGFRQMQHYFDVIVVDAPCSGSGLFRREPQAIAEWSLDHVRLCSHRQQRILADCWPSLKPGGVLIYSTCSYSKEENEDILDWMMEALEVNSLPLAVMKEWGIVETISKKGAHGYRFYPDRLEGEGLFMAAVRKNKAAEGEETACESHKAKSHKAKHPAGKLTRQEQERLKDWVRSERPLFFFTHNDHVHMLPEQLTNELPYLQSNGYLKKAGVLAGQLAEKEFIPDHELALSTLVSGRLPVVTLSREQAIQYLRKEEIVVDSTQKGWALAQYEGHNLGWVKILANRVNNYYPREWRILKRDP